MSLCVEISEGCIYDIYSLLQKGSSKSFHVLPGRLLTLARVMSCCRDSTGSCHFWHMPDRWSSPGIGSTTEFGTLSHSWPPSGMSGHLKSTWRSESLWISWGDEGVGQSYDSFYSLCLNVCFVFITMSHAAVCLVQPIFTFYNIMGIWLKYIQLGWSYHFVVSITTRLTKFEGLVVYLFVWWCMTWFSSVATAVLLWFRGTLRFGSWVI